MTNKLEIAVSGNTFQIEIRANEGSYRAFIKETVDGVALPVRMGFIDFVGNEGNQFMVLKAPIRQKDADGQFLTRARQKDGKFVDGNGKEVATEAEAAREFVYLTQRNDESKLVYAQIGTLNVKNTKADNTPTAMTLISAKIYSDDEALSAERISYKMSAAGKDHPDYAKLAAEIKEVRRSTGTWHNFFINSGAEILREKGFEVRVKERNDSPSPQA